MKNSNIILLFCGMFLYFFSCKKDITTTPLQSVIKTSSDEYYKETSLPVQTSVSHDIDANVGGYLEALPASYASHKTKKYPLLIFLHGDGQFGNGSIADLSKLTNSAIPGLIKSKKFPANFIINNNSFQFIVITPQFKVWPATSDVNDVLNYVLKKYNVDTARVYICGSSMGGGVAWDYSAAYGKRLAAIVPICGASWPTTEKASNISKTNVCVWALHNYNDQLVPTWYSQNYVSYINGDKPHVAARLTLFAVKGHNAWTEATDPDYKENGQNIYEWMLSNRNAN